MHDAFLKSVFADRRMVEILLIGQVPEWASEIDFFDAAGGIHRARQQENAAAAPS